MEFMLLCCFEEREWNNLPDAERERVMRDYGALIDELGKSGHRLGGGKLRSSAAAITVRGEGGQVVSTDGPFAETKEQLGGYHVVECKDMDEAVSIASRIPTLRVGGVVEVRALEQVS